MQKDRSQRIGAIGWESYTQHMFFAELDFEALVRKQIPPVFRPSSEKTNFDATYDLEELLLEEAPLEARARRQKPRAELREDATAKEIRDDELHRLIETMFEPFDYTLTDYQGNAADAIAAVTWVMFLFLFTFGPNSFYQQPRGVFPRQRDNPRKPCCASSSILSSQCLQTHTLYPTRRTISCSQPKHQPC